MTFDLRALVLGPEFQPKVQDIPTPDVLTAKGAPDDLLRLVSLSVKERAIVYGSLGDDAMLNSALLIATTLRFRDSGGPDGKGTPVFSPTDASAIIEQDGEVFDILATTVKSFLGLSEPTGQAVIAAKNDSATTPQSGGGTESPSTSDSPPSEPVSPPSETPIS